MRFSLKNFFLNNSFAITGMTVFFLEKKKKDKTACPIFILFKFAIIFFKKWVIYDDLLFIYLCFAAWHVGFSNQGSNLRLLHWQHGILTSGPPEKCSMFKFSIKSKFNLEGNTMLDMFKKWGHFLREKAILAQGLTLRSSRALWRQLQRSCTVHTDDISKHSKRLMSSLSACEG